MRQQDLLGTRPLPLPEGSSENRTCLVLLLYLIRDISMAKMILYCSLCLTCLCFLVILPYHKILANMLLIIIRVFGNWVGLIIARSRDSCACVDKKWGVYFDFREIVCASLFVKQLQGQVSPINCIKEWLQQNKRVKAFPNRVLITLLAISTSRSWLKA